MDVDEKPGDSKGSPEKKKGHDAVLVSTCIQLPAIPEETLQVFLKLALRALSSYARNVRGAFCRALDRSWFDDPAWHMSHRSDRSADLFEEFKRDAPDSFSGSVLAVSKIV